LLLISSHASSAAQEPDYLLKRIAKGVIHNTMKSIKDWQKQAQDGGSVFGLERELGSIWQNPITCNTCHFAMNSFDWVLSRQTVRSVLETIITYGCSFYMNGTVCDGAVHEMGNVLVPQLTEFVLTGDYSCSRLFGFCSSPSWVTLNHADYIRRVISEKPDIIKNNDFIDNLYKEIENDKKTRETIRVLHMSDLHVDMMYSPGSSVNCGEPLC
jgi:hypothetical protein